MYVVDLRHSDLLLAQSNNIVIHPVIFSTLWWLPASGLLRLFLGLSPFPSILFPLLFPSFPFSSLPSHKSRVLPFLPLPFLRSLLLCLSTPAGAQAADDTPPLRLILCLALRFAPAQFHVSQLLLNCPLPCVLSSSSVSTTLRGPSQELYSLYCCQLSSLCAQSRSTSYE